jgi:hypothetical protein
MAEMMKAMMQGQGGDQFDMEEMQRAWILAGRSLSVIHRIFRRHDVSNGRRFGRARGFGGSAKHGQYG